MTMMTILADWKRLMMSYVRVMNSEKYKLYSFLLAVIGKFRTCSSATEDT